ncbi:MAG: hypothetical protein HYW01_07445 [Deltaproteobacteria bacterium]|nr:hypothetical protein [Deltaproteobacteria bacterium]
MKKLLPLAVALIVPLLLFSFTSGIRTNASEDEDEGITKLIESATTPEDHMKIADYYEKQAAKAERKARFHASMGDSYKNRSKPLAGLATHCSNLANKYKEAAEEYKAMATEHRKMAQEMQMQ